MTPSMTVTSASEITPIRLTELESAMLEHMKYIVLEEKRCFCGLDFRRFEYDGKEYGMDSGTCRNKICKFKKLGLVEFRFLSSNAYYSLPGHNFSIEVTLNHAGVPLDIGRQTPLYKWLKNRPREKQSLHDIRLIFSATGFWNAVYQNFSEINPNNQDINLPTMEFTKDIIIKVTVHHTDTVSVAIACTNRPIVIDIPDILDMIEVLTRLETKLAALCGPSVNIPHYKTWIVKMWHFGFDFLDRYDKKEFHIVFEEGISDLWRFYTKRWKDGKVRVRGEHQEYLNKPIIEGLLDKLFKDGEII